MEQNLAEIISNNCVVHKLEKYIVGICANSENCNHLYKILSKCNGCKNLICSSCTNFKQNVCVICKQYVLKTLKCGHKINRLMCWGCSEILTLCDERCYPRQSAIIFVNNNGNFEYMCDKC